MRQLPALPGYPPRHLAGIGACCAFDIDAVASAMYKQLLEMLALLLIHLQYSQSQVFIEQTRNGEAAASAVASKQPPTTHHRIRVAPCRGRDNVQPNPANEPQETHWITRFPIVRCGSLLSRLNFETLSAQSI